MSLLLLFGGSEAPPNVVETTAAINIAFTNAAAADVAAIVETTAAIGLALEIVAASKIWVVPTASVGLSLTPAVTGWTRTRQPTAVIPVTFTHAVSSSIYPSDTIDLEVVWTSSLGVGAGETMTYDGLVDLLMSATSTADDNSTPDYYRIKLDSGAWSAWTAVSTLARERYKKRGPQYILYNYDLTSSGYGDHTIYVEFRDDDLNVIGTPASVAVSYKDESNSEYEPPASLSDNYYKIHRIARTDVAIVRGDMRRVEK